MDYIVDYTESVLIWGHVIICDHVEACLYFGKMFVSVFSSKVYHCLQLLTFRRFGGENRMLWRTKEERTNKIEPKQLCDKQFIVFIALSFSKMKMEKKNPNFFLFGHTALHMGS